MEEPEAETESPKKNKDQVGEYKRLISFLVIRLGKSFDEIARMTIPQARMLQRSYPEVDGHRETARLIVESLVDLAVAAGMVKRKESAPSRRPETDACAVVVPDTLIPELQAAVEAQLRPQIEAQMQAEGWQPPVPATE